MKHVRHAVIIRANRGCRQQQQSIDRYFNKDVKKIILKIKKIKWSRQYNQPQ
jgi:hypothetical protein